MKYDFLKNEIRIENIGEPDKDNSFLLAKGGPAEEFEAFLESHPDCTPIGVCHEAITARGFFAMVFEEDFERYYVHIPKAWESLLEESGRKP